MSFDSFYDEAGNFNEAAAREENDFDDFNEAGDDFWDDEYDWTETSLRHEVVDASGYNEVEGDSLNGD